MKPLPRRVSAASPSHTDARVRALVELMRDEYLEMSDMALTVGQACTLWGADRTAMVRALTHLVEQGVLRVSHGRYVLAR
jgi:hypothetical protein